jgi:hypothetical protein
MEDVGEDERGESSSSGWKGLYENAPLPFGIIAPSSCADIGREKFIP